MQDQSTLMSSKCDTLCAAFGIESSGTSTHLKPTGAEPGAVPPAVDGGVITRTLVSESAADTPFLIAETSTQYVSASPIARPISGSSKPSPTSAPIAESPCISEASILAQAVRTPPATKGAARAVAAPAAPALGVCTLKGQSGAGMLNLFSSSVLQRPGVSVLFARSDSCYFDLVDDVWDAQRDARGYTGANPVVCHPPCRGWGRLRHWAKPRPDEKALALFAVEQVRRCGGVLEHPWGSTLWHAAGLPHPGKVDAWGGWTLLVDQGWWGHAAPKPTYLYIVGCSREELGELPVQLHRAEGRTLHLSPADRERTPPAFARFLVDLAAKCAGSLLQPPAAAVTASCATSTVTAAQVRSNSDLAAPARAASKRAAFKAWAQA